MRIFNFDEQLIPLDEWIQTAVDWTVLNYRDFFQVIKVPVELSLEGLEWLFATQSAKQQKTNKKSSDKYKTLLCVRYKPAGRKEFRKFQTSA